MFDESIICPYTGLRSFTEDESIYFKGREEHIDQASEQLQRNKFLMLTGASGDGKSSLVYAGIIPNARAGFLKSKFSQWCVADFRPERNPFQNLCRALGKQLGIENQQIVEAELQHGFSSLVDLYKNSRCFADYHSAGFKNATAAQQLAMRRDAANLLILVDQFEEFFTNPENYRRGVPSEEANLVINLLLETVRIAMDEDLPIYVVFTMRSDYIGECAAFRALPEYIGFSQFFVPRLNREQLQRVIEEPATLTGNRISRRLTERLIHDIEEGVDQLPILQHALNQIWHAAAKGTEELDLIHYAFVGGLSPEELPDEHTAEFKLWFERLPSAIKACYREPNLQNVLDTHANKLFESATDAYQRRSGQPLEAALVKDVVKKAFTCLTKIDESRAVRNRMTLAEICGIINDERITVATLADILYIFREPGNTFIRPFVSDGNERSSLTESDVLDITHESLIRNWEYLEQWAKEEHDRYNVSLDFEVQLQRWIDSGKSSDFLLSIGPLTYFEKWYNETKPNPWWIGRYLSDDSSAEKKLQQAQAILENANEFLRRSARRHIVTRTVMRYGPRKVVGVLAIITVFVLGSFATVDYYEKRNPVVLARISDRVEALASNPNILIRQRASLICEQLKLGLTTVTKTVSAIEDPVERINVAVGVAGTLVYYGRNEPASHIEEAISISDSLLAAFLPGQHNAQQTAGVLKEVRDFAAMLELAAYYNPASENIRTIQKQNARRAGEWALHLLHRKPDDFRSVALLNVCIQTALSHQVLAVAEIDSLIAMLSPFDRNVSPWVTSRYDRDQVFATGFWGYGARHNGLYQELAYLYASRGDTKSTMKCLDTLLKYNQNYFQNDYATAPDNASHVAAYFYRYGYLDALDVFVSEYAVRKKVSEHLFYNMLLARCKLYEFASTALDVDPNWGNHDYNLVLEYSDEKQLAFFFNKYRNAVARLENPNERKFLTALSFKDQAMLHSKQTELLGPDSLKSKYYYFFDQALALYREVDRSYLEEDISIIDLTASDDQHQPRKFLFIYPDVRTPFHPNEPRLFHFFYTAETFLRYLVEKELITTLYLEKSDRMVFPPFFRDYSQCEVGKAYQVINPISFQTLIGLEKQLAQHGTDTSANLNLLYLYLIKNPDLDPTLLVEYSRKITGDKLRQYFFNTFNPNVAFRLIGETVANVWNVDPNRADEIVKLFNNRANRSSLYGYAAISLLRRDPSSKAAYDLVDSCALNIDALRKTSIAGPGRQQMALAAPLIAPEREGEDAMLIIKNMTNKFNVMPRICRGLAMRERLYDAVSIIPPNISQLDQGGFYWHILNGYTEVVTSQSDRSWNQYDEYRELGLTNFINYVDDRN